MTLDEARMAWHALDDDPALSLSDDDILALVKSRAARFERQIRRRDWREVIAALVGAVLIAPVAAHSGLVTRVGVVIVIAGLVLIVVKLRLARPGHAGPRLDVPVSAVLQAEQARVDAQIGLLQTVLWWYVAPIAIGSVMIVGGTAGASRFTFWYAVGVALLSWGVVWLNTRAVRRVLRPLRDELTELLSSIASPSADTNELR
jgi:small neutral amino acid transporter SnatA (MarC family)